MITPIPDTFGPCWLLLDDWSEWRVALYDQSEFSTSISYITSSGIFDCGDIRTLSGQTAPLTATPPPSPPRKASSMESISFRIPFPPSVNHYWRHGKRGTYISQPGQLFAAEVMVDVRRQLVAHESITSRVAVSLELTPPTRRKCDIDNYVKSALDAICKAGVLANDEQVDKLIVTRLPVESPGCCDVTITPLTESD